MAVRSAVTIPTELLEQVERGNVLLFVGERLRRDPSGEAIFDRLATELAERAGIADAPSLSFPEIAQAYEDERGRQALVDFVSRRIAELGDEPQPVHRLIAGLTQCSVLVTTTLSGRLERAFRDAGRKLQLVIGNEDIAFEDQQVAQLYKLRGSLDRRESLVLTEDDHEQFFEAHDSISVALQGYLARKTILFIGYDLADDHFKRLYSKTIATLDRFPRRSYAFGEAPQPQLARWCKRKGIDMVAANIADFLQALADQLAERERAKTFIPTHSDATSPPLPQQPYKLLDYYEADDAAIYFGREHETQDLSARIRAHRLTLLYGASGVGKTSLLLAGAAPRLAQQDQPYEMIYARALEDPAQAIRRALTRRLPDAALAQDVPLVDFLAAAAKALDRTVVLVLDQFEEFFIRLSPQFRAAFTAELGAICDARDVPIKVVLSLREDWLASINELEQRIPEIFRNRMRVLPLTRAQAEQAITAPVERLGVRYEPALVERLLNDLAGSASAEIMPPQLQLVCSALYRRLSPDEHMITLASYEQIGGARGVLQKYLDDELARLGHDDRMLARGVLAELVTTQGTKAVRSADELTLALDTPPATLVPVLEALVRARLLRAIEREDGAQSYELAHEYLIHEIALEDDAKARKQVEELIRHEVDNWQRFGTLLAADKLALINDARAVLRLGPEAQELLLRSALEVDDEIDFWLGRMADPAQRARVLAEKARTRVPAVRRRTARVLGTQDVPESVEPLLALALRDPDDSVRDAARASLAQLTAQRPTLIARLRAATQSKEREERAPALRTLALLPLRELPTELRRPVLAARLRLRTAQIVHTTVATPARRATLLTTALLLTVVLLTALVSISTYFIDVHPAVIQGKPYDITVQRGLPILSGFSQIEIDTGVDLSQVSPDQFDVVTRRQLWGAWLLHGKRDYDQWGKDLAVTLQLDEGVQMLWYLNRGEGLKWLQEAASSSNNSSRAWSAQALGELLFAQPELPPARMHDELLRLIKDPDYTVRMRAIDALGQTASNPQENSAVVVATLLPLLKDADMRSSATNALGQVTSNPHTNAATVVAAVLPLLKDPDSTVRESAARVLGQALALPQTKTAALVAELLPLLKDPVTKVRVSAAYSLGQGARNPHVDAATLVAAVLPLLKDADYNMRASAAKVLGQLVRNPRVNAAAVVAALLPLLRDADPNVGASAAYVLGQAMRNPQANATAVAAVLPLLKDPDFYVRASAADVLGQAASSPQANAALVAALLPLLKDADPGVRRSAADVLGQALALPQTNTVVVATVLSLLNDPDSSVRASAAYALGQATRNPQVNAAVVAALLPLLRDADANVRMSAAYALGQATINPQTDTAVVVVTLLPLLKDADTNVRANAAYALGQAAGNPHKDGAVVTALLRLLNDPDVYVRTRAAEALGQAASNPQVNATVVVAALLPLLKDADPNVRNSAAAALVEIYAQPGRTAADPIRVQTFETLIDPQSSLPRPSAARALFLIALRDQKQEQSIRDYLNTDAYARSREPIALLWSNKVLTMLDIADVVHPAAQGTDAQQQSALQLIKEYQTTSFFGEDFTWAARQAEDWLNEQMQAAPGANP